MLFLICLYISSRALSKAFEHRNFVARYQRETNHITVAKVASLVTIAYNIVETFIYIINYISKTEIDLWTLQFFDFFTWWVPLQVYRYSIQTYSFYFLLPSCICWHVRKQKCRFLFCCFISVLLWSIATLQFHTFCNSFTNTGYKFLYFTSILYLHRQLIRISYPPFWIFVIETCNYVNVWRNA